MSDQKVISNPRVVDSTPESPGMPVSGVAFGGEGDTSGARQISKFDLVKLYTNMAILFASVWSVGVFVMMYWAVQHIAGDLVVLGAVVMCCAAIGMYVFLVRQFINKAQDLVELIRYGVATYAYATRRWVDQQGDESRLPLYGYALAFKDQSGNEHLVEATSKTKYRTANEGGDSPSQESRTNAGDRVPLLHDRKEASSFVIADVGSIAHRIAFSDSAS